MWTVGLISKECCKTYHYNDFTEAEKEYKTWLNCFKLNNDIESRTTVIKRDCNDKIKSIKNIISVNHDLELYFLFLSEDVN